MELNFDVSEEDKTEDDYVPNTFDFPIGMKLLRRSAFNQQKLFRTFYDYNNYDNISLIYYSLQLEMDILLAFFTDL